MAKSENVDDIIKQWALARPELDVSGLAVFGPLHRSFLLYRAQIHEIFEQFGTNEAGFDVLAALRRTPGFRLTAGELAAQTLVTTGGLTLRVNRLEESGLVVRERDHEDARVVYVTLTEEGKRLIDKVAEAHFANERRMLAAFGKAKEAELASLLADLENALRQTAVDPTSGA